MICAVHQIPVTIFGRGVIALAGVWANLMYNRAHKSRTLHACIPTISVDGDGDDDNVDDDDDNSSARACVDLFLNVALQTQ